MKRGWFIGTAIVGVLTLGGVAAGYAYARQHWVSTDYARFVAPTAWVSAPATGTLGQVRVSPGEAVQPGTVVTTVHTATGTRVAVTAGAAGRIASLAVHRGDPVTAGQPLMAVVDVSQGQVLAEIPGSDAGKVGVGYTAHCRFTADPGISVAGTVDAIGGAALAWPAPPSSGAYVRQTQWIPVRIRLEGVRGSGVPLIAGESVSVRIDR
ncbi:Biotin attachment protein [Candidatus Hydrogenisulfobacillus filiaventi]|uniref:Biotin attachment protein n=1 Tax=Candidatus Hydrogenisulfobacillus filiaventi TaxID=2707344 RepID=A0A6F8ZEB6_9FIRM|nr:efflux RND transporter periplasmic adaptor subunit [Bacillota bacterium]CAB1128346.1 Biotin attachment protein [Candidatus Hydrogenisulfobacillus filiaventi]